VQTVAHGGHHAKVSTAATERPKQLLFIVVGRDDDSAIRENDLCGEEIVERKSEAADQCSVTAAQGESRHANGATRARNRREAERIGHRENVRGARTSRNSGGVTVGADGHIFHRAQVDDDSVAQRTTGPVVAAAPHRQRETTVARGPNRRLDVFRRPAVDDGARHAADRLWPDRRCGGVAVIARSRDTARQVRPEPSERSFDQISHFSVSPGAAGANSIV
jgi:hypothetical protein